MRAPAICLLSSLHQSLIRMTFVYIAMLDQWASLLTLISHVTSSHQTSTKARGVQRILGPDHVQVNCSWKWIVDWKSIDGKNLGWSANCWPSQPKFNPTIQVWSTIHIQLQFTCTLYMIQALKTINFLPDNTWSPIRWILFLVKISLTILVMLVKAPFWISVIKLLVRFTDKSLVCVENTSGVKRSEKKRKNILKM